MKKYRVANITKGLYFTQYSFYKVDGEYVEFKDESLAREFAEVNNASVVDFTNFE